MASPASSSTPHLLLLYAGCFLLSLSLDAPRSIAAAEAASPVSFSFDFSNTSTQSLEDLKFEGDASFHGKLVDLTCNSYGTTINNCTGRMSYNHSVPFYDKSTRELASFTTRFTFAIVRPDSETMKNRGDGMAFFLASYPSSMPQDSEGGHLGLIADGGSSDGLGPDRRFVAVEFDTFNNSWEQPSNTYDHIGIDISSVAKSVNTTSLGSFGLNGSMTASITFDNTTWMLVASLQFDDHPSLRPVQVSTKLKDPLTLLPSEVAVGFCGATGAHTELHQIMSWSFKSTLAPLQKGSHGKKAAILIGGLIGGALLLVLLVWFIILWWKWISGRHALDRRMEATRRFEYRDLAAATDNFSEQNKLGQGAFGAVYRGTSLKGLDGEVAVKKILEEIREGHKDFFDEFKTISEAKHKNLVKLKGWCRRGNILDFMCWCRRKNDELFLIYELVPNGNLYDHLHNREAAVLPWRTRYKIVKDIGAALVYLHDECQPYILHRDIKPSNILLDNDFNAKLADFGLSRIANQDNATMC